MRLFVRNLFKYLALVALWMAFCFTYNSYRVANMETLPVAKTIVVGDSRMMTGLNPKLLESTLNYAQNSESYFVSYFKLKYILAHSVNVKNVVLGFSYPNFSAYQDNFYDGDIATADVLNRIYPIVKLKDFQELKVDKFKYNLARFRNMFLYPHNDHTPFLGSYIALPETNKTSSAESIIQRHYFTKESKNVGVSTINTNYLDSIQLLTLSKNIELLLVNLPMPSDYIKLVPLNFKKHLNVSKSRLQKCSNVTILDFEGDVDCPPYYFRDAAHLSQSGANVYSKRINRAIGAIR